VTAAEASADTALRARVVVTSGASSRAVSDALRGYCLHRSVRTAIHAALAAEGVEVETIPARTQAEIDAWRGTRQRQWSPAVTALPDGYALERCECGREYPRLLSEAIGKCPRCWRKLVEEIQG
jgi:hypothetical protein